MKFKVGDKVRILLSAVDVGVWEGEVGSIGKVISGNDIVGYLVEMLNPCRMVERRVCTWSVKSFHITHALVVGQQLSFSFMEKGE